VDFRVYYLYASYVLERQALVPDRERNWAEQETNAKFLRTKDMEVKQLKERAFHLTCPNKARFPKLIT
jgi:hypothetical protein